MRVWQNAGWTEEQSTADPWSALVICDDTLNKLCEIDEDLSSQKKSHRLDGLLLSALRQALNVIGNH